MFTVTGTAEVPSANAQMLTLNLSANASSSKPQLTLSQVKNPKRRQIQDLQAWMEAWNLYVLVTVAHYPERALERLGYQQIICEVSTKFRPHIWLSYDSQFRALAAEIKILRCDRKDADLWLQCFTGQHATGSQATAPGQAAEVTAPQKIRRPCTHCGSITHYPENCLKSPFRTVHPSYTARSSYNQQTPNPRWKGNFPSPGNTRQDACKDFQLWQMCLSLLCIFARVPTVQGKPPGEILRHQLPQLASISWSLLYDCSNLSLN